MSGRSPFRKTYLAVGVAAILGAYAYFVESRKPDGGEKKKDKERALAINKVKADSLELRPREGEVVRLVKEGKSWRMAAPAPGGADANEVESILTALEGLEIEESVAEAGGKLSDFGLDPPKITVSVGLEGAQQPLTLLLGDKTPDGGGLYAKLPAAPRVFTVPGYQESSFTKKAFDLRDRDLLHVKRDAVKTLEITGPEESYALLRDDKGEWSFARPLTTRAARWSVDGLLGTLESLKLESVAAEEAKDLKPFGLAKPSRTVTLGLADGTTKRLEIGSSTPEKKFHAREASSSLVAVIAGALVEDLAKGMKELRQKRLADIPTYDVEGFDLETEGKRSVHARSAAKEKDGAETQKWKRTAPDTKDLERGKVDDALFKIAGLEVQEFVDQPQAATAYGFDAPLAKLALRFGGGKPGLELTLGRKDGSTWARRPGDDAVLKLDSAKVDEALKALKEL